MSSLRDVAQRASVSIAAASAALGGRPSAIGVGAETRRRILTAARELRYRRNPLAASLRTGRTHNIGIWLPNAEAYLAHPQGARNFWRICQAAARHGYHASILVPDSGQVDPRSLDGCFIMDELAPDRMGEATRLARAVPVLSMTAPIEGAIMVREDRSWNVCRKRAAEYLYRLGHRRIAVTFLSDRGPQPLIPGQFEEAARVMGVAAEVIPFGQVHLDRRYLSMDRILDLDPPPTAAFAIDDDYARVLIMRLAERGRRVPEDISVFSGSTHDVPDGRSPAITGLVLHFESELDEIFLRFARIIEGKDSASEIHIPPLKVELIERESCAPPRAC